MGEGVGGSEGVIDKNQAEITWGVGSTYHTPNNPPPPQKKKKKNHTKNNNTPHQPTK